MPGFWCGTCFTAWTSYAQSPVESTAVPDWFVLHKIKLKRDKRVPLEVAAIKSQGLRLRVDLGRKSWRFLKSKKGRLWPIAWVCCSAAFRPLTGVMRPLASAISACGGRYRATEEKALDQQICDDGLPGKGLRIPIPHVMRWRLFSGLQFPYARRHPARWRAVTAAGAMSSKSFKRVLRVRGHST